MAATRRGFVSSVGAMAVAGALPISAHATNDDWTHLRAAATHSRLLGQDGPPTAIWSFNGTAPGPIIRVRKGGMVKVRLRNDLEQSTSVHWHGVRIANRMDGVPGLTQSPVAPGETFDYEFVAPDAGTYWYHSHDRSWEQVARGLHGLLIVEEETPPFVDQDVILALDDWRLTDDGQFDTRSLGHMMDLSHGGRLGNVVTINGRNTIADISVRAGERIRLRLCNVANARIFTLRIVGHSPNIVALDGQPVAPFEPPGGGVGLAPGQRVDMIFDAEDDPGSRHPIVLDLGNGEIVAGHVTYQERTVMRANPVDAPIRIPANDLPATLETEGATSIELLMEGGAMGRMPGAMFGGRHMGMRDLAGEGMIWAFNGVAGRPDEPLFSAKLGETVIVTIVNETAWPHAMHWHGHHAHVLDPGSGERAGVWRDTVLSLPGERMRIAFRTDNPGKWLLHCHMLEHQVAGMITWFEVGGSSG